MNSVSLGDLSQSFMMQRRSVALRETMTTLTDELSSGKVSDVKDVLAGNQNYLSDLERSLEVLEGYSVANSEAAYFTSSMQSSLSRVQDFAGQLGLDLVLAGGGPVGVIAGSPSENAATQLQGIMNSLNGAIAGRNLFSGTSTDQAPLETSDILLTQLAAAVAGATTPDDIIIAAQTWFDDPAGFDDTIYIGSDTALAPFSLSETERVSLDIRANDPALKQTLMYTAIAALADDPALGLSVTQQSELFRSMGLGLQSNQDQLTDLRSRIGVAEARIETINVRNVAEATSVEFARNALLLADPFETATKLENVQFQLQSLYAVTVRSSQLSLVNFL
ncbi:MAG: flagellar hook protein [Roseobacter sp.]|jgi:flagellar hook-associated protein 3 FlgL|nr:flagellar hook protein [Roseobacter sp.]